MSSCSKLDFVHFEGPRFAIMLADRPEATAHKVEVPCPAAVDISTKSLLGNSTGYALVAIRPICSTSHGHALPPLYEQLRHRYDRGKQFRYPPSLDELFIGTVSPQVYKLVRGCFGELYLLKRRT